MESLEAVCWSEGSYDSHVEEQNRLAEEEWEESMEQLRQLVSIIFQVVPFLCKWLGRRWSYWGA